VTDSGQDGTEDLELIERDRRRASEKAVARWAWLDWRKGAGIRLLSCKVWVMSFEVFSSSYLEMLGLASPLID
jgi:hypothetical protein